MLHRSFRLLSVNRAAEAVLNRIDSERGVLSRSGASFAKWALRPRKIDEMANYVDNDLRFQFHGSFRWMMDLYTFALVVPPFYLMFYNYVNVSDLAVVSGMVSQERYDRLWAQVPWQSVVVGQAMIWWGIYYVSAYLRYPVFLHVLAPLWKRLGLVRQRASGGPVAQSIKPSKSGWRQPSGR